MRGVQKDLKSLGIGVAPHLLGNSRLVAAVSSGDPLQVRTQRTEKILRALR